MPITATETSLPGVLVLEPMMFRDDRGFFYETFNRKEFERASGLKRDFVQDNHSRSVRGVLRGMHYQVKQPQGKLVRVISGEVFDVAVDLRRDSPHFRQWVGVVLSAENRRQLWVPEGFAHGFFVTSDIAEVLYKTTEYWMPDHDRTLLWSDPCLGIEWPLEGYSPLLSSKDALATRLDAADVF
jgi:dTDP-4-dehydrorhamnose 3,5-epimerase